MRVPRVISILAIRLRALLAAGAAPAEAKVDVVTSDQNLSWLVKQIGGNNVSTEFLSGSSQDPHFVQPRPSQVARLSRADMVVRIGMPQGKLDPSRGDIHIYGNPHYFDGPSSLPIAARNVRDGLKRVDPKNGAAYDGAYSSFVQRLNGKIAEWKSKMAADRGKSVVTYHMSLIYFLSDFGLSEFGYVEPRPGLQPTPAHISTLAGRMKQDNIKVILTENYRPRRYADLLASQTGAKVIVIPGGIGAEKGTDDYFQFIDTIVSRVAGAL